MATVKAIHEHGGVHTKNGHISAVTYHRPLKLVLFIILDIVLSFYDMECYLFNLYTHEF